MKKGRNGRNLRVPTAGATSQTPADESHEESPLVHELRQQLQEAQRKCQELLRTNTEQQQRLKEQDKIILQKEASKNELEENLALALQQNRTYVKYNQRVRRDHKKELQKLIEMARQRVNEYVEPILDENETLQQISANQEACIARQQTELKEKNKIIQNLQEQIANDRSFMEVAKSSEKHLTETNRNLLRQLEEKQALLDKKDHIIKKGNEHLSSAKEKLMKELEKYKEENMVLRVQLEEAIKKAEGQKMLLTTTNSLLQQEQEKNQVLQKELSALQLVHTSQKKEVSEAKNKTQELEENLKAEKAEVQTLKTNLDKQKMTFLAVINKYTTAHQSLKEENQKHQDNIKDLTVALSNVSEEKTTVLQRCEELTSALKESENQLQQTKTRAEELQVQLDQNKRKKRRWFRCWP